MTKLEIAKKDNKHAAFSGIFTGYAIAMILAILGDVFKIHFTTPNGDRYLLFTLAVPLLTILVFSMFVLRFFDSYFDKGVSYPLVNGRQVYTRDYCKAYRKFIPCGVLAFVFYYLISSTWINREEKIGWVWFVSIVTPFLVLVFFEFKRIKNWYYLNFIRSQ